MALDLGSPVRKWVALPTHRNWLLAAAGDLLDFFEGASVNPKGGFFDLDENRKPLPATPPADTGWPRGLHSTTRMVHCFAVAHLMGRPGAEAMIDHGMDFLWNGHRDTAHGGYFWSVGDNGPIEATKQAYGHAFVLLAASSAKVVGHPDADRLLDDVSGVLMERFWDDDVGASREEFTADWQPLSAYRGQNSNMHLTEACMAAFEATGDGKFLTMAERIATLIVKTHAAATGWRLPEHFTEDWVLDKDYSGSPMFRPFGTTPGHWLEWARLLVQCWQLGDKRQAWMPQAAEKLFRQACAEGWDKEKGGFYYTLDWEGRPRIRDRYWWPCCEGIGAAAFLNAHLEDPFYEEWYRRIWDWTASYLIDRETGSWRPQVDADLKPSSDPFFGRPDIYHALQACVIPLLPATGSVTRGLAEGALA